MDDHLIYMTVWLWMAISHWVLLAPWNLAWFTLFFISDAPYEGFWYDFYKFWLRDVIVTAFPWVILVTIAAWFSVIVLDFNNEDDVFLVVYPAFAVGVYILIVPLTALLINDNWESAVKYFDANEMEAYKNEKKTAEGPQILGGDVMDEEETAADEEKAADAGADAGADAELDVAAAAQAQAAAATLMIAF